MDITNIFAVGAIALLGAISPGPDFAIVTKNSLSGSYRTGFLTACGITCALLVHVSYCILGIAILIRETPIIFDIIKYLGAAYLFYLGVVLLREKVASSELQNPTKRDARPFLSGFLCNLLNPKATLFILSLFSQFIDPGMDVLQKVVLGGVVAVTTMLWFSTLAYFISHPLFQKRIVGFQGAITKVMGVALCALALHIAFIAG